MQFSHFDWNQVNFKHATALALLGIMDTQTFGAKASNEFVHTTRNGPMVRLQYQKEESQMKLDAYIPENFDLTIGRVIGLSMGSENKSMIWSSEERPVPASRKNANAFEAIYSELLTTEYA